MKTTRKLWYRAVLKDGRTFNFRTPQAAVSFADKNAGTYLGPVDFSDLVLPDFLKAK